MESPESIAESAGARAFGAKLIMNVFRGLVVEAIVNSALSPDWEWRSEDYYRYDFLHHSGAWLEIKQSAACQSWPSKMPSSARWDIAERKGYYDGERYIEKAGRNADIYVFAWHPCIDREKADHRDPSQWTFFVIRASLLPATKTMHLPTPLPRDAISESMARWIVVICRPSAKTS